jgi:hypothetical protein
MASAKHEPRAPSDSYTFELPYDNDLDQDELNRLMRKPGEPASSPPANRGEPANSQASDAQGESATESHKA